MFSTSPKPSETTTFHEWLKQVIEHGEAVFSSAPSAWKYDDNAIRDFLQQYHALESLDLAGPPIPLDVDSALWAARTLAAVCWEVATGQPDPPKKAIAEPKPNSPATHFSVDLFFRFLPKALQRARVAGMSESLVERLELLLNQWPLSGVLFPGEGRPLTDLDFSGHCGLQILFAERSLKEPRPAWIPSQGKAREWVECVYAQNKQSLPIELSGSTAPQDE